MAQDRNYLQALGVIGFDRCEVIILAALVSEDSMFPIGRRRLRVRGYGVWQA